MKRYTKTEWSLLAACFFAYTAAYISRCSLTPSLDAIAKTFGITAAQAGSDSSGLYQSCRSKKGEKK